jgi:hypothetical protein
MAADPTQQLVDLPQTPPPAPRGAANGGETVTVSPRVTPLSDGEPTSPQPSPPSENQALPQDHATAPAWNRELFVEALQQMVSAQAEIARTSAWKQVHEYLRVWTHAMERAAQAAEAAALACSATAVPAPMYPSLLVGPGSSSAGLEALAAASSGLSRERGHDSSEEEDQPQSLEQSFDLQEPLWTEVGGLSLRASTLRAADLPPSLPSAADTPRFHFDEWPQVSKGRARAELSSSFPDEYSFARRLFDAVTAGPADVVVFLPDGGFEVRNPQAFVSVVKQVFDAEPLSFVRQANKYGMKTRWLRDPEGQNTSVRKSWDLGAGSAIAWWHPLFLQGRDDLLAFFTPHNPRMFGPKHFEVDSAVVPQHPAPVYGPPPALHPGWPAPFAAPPPHWWHPNAGGVPPPVMSAHSRSMQASLMRYAEEDDASDESTPPPPRRPRGRPRKRPRPDGEAIHDTTAVFNPESLHRSVASIQGGGGVVAPGPFSPYSTVRPAEIRRLVERIKRTKRYEGDEEPATNGSPEEAPGTAVSAEEGYGDPPPETAVVPPEPVQGEDESAA